MAIPGNLNLDPPVTSAEDLRYGFRSALIPPVTRNVMLPGGSWPSTRYAEPMTTAYRSTLEISPPLMISATFIPLALGLGWDDLLMSWPPETDLSRLWVWYGLGLFVADAEREMQSNVDLFSDRAVAWRETNLMQATSVIWSGHYQDGPPNRCWYRASLYYAGGTATATRMVLTQPRYARSSWSIDVTHFFSLTGSLRVGFRTRNMMVTNVDIWGADIVCPDGTRLQRHPGTYHVPEYEPEPPYNSGWLAAIQR